ncbi:hypothetical protein [Streptomyces sp. 2A115]
MTEIEQLLTSVAADARNSRPWDLLNRPLALRAAIRRQAPSAPHAHRT